MTDPNDLIWMQSKQKKTNNVGGWWSNHVTGLRWRCPNGKSKCKNKENKIEYALDKKFAITDTGSSCILGPKDAINYLVSSLEDFMGATASDPNWGTLFFCEKRTSMPDFDLLVDEYWMRVR